MTLPTSLVVTSVSIRIAVGTALASSSPHGSVLAVLPHTALTSDDVGTALLGPRVKYAGSG